MEIGIVKLFIDILQFFLQLFGFSKTPEEKKTEVLIHLKLKEIFIHKLQLDMQESLKGPQSKPIQQKLQNGREQSKRLIKNSCNEKKISERMFNSMLIEGKGIVHFGIEKIDGKLREVKSILEEKRKTVKQVSTKNEIADRLEFIRIRLKIIDSLKARFSSAEDAVCSQFPPDFAVARANSELKNSIKVYNHSFPGNKIATNQIRSFDEDTSDDEKYLYAYDRFCDAQEIFQKALGDKKIADHLFQQGMTKRCINKKTGFQEAVRLFKESKNYDKRFYGDKNEIVCFTKLAIANTDLEIAIRDKAEKQRDEAFKYYKELLEELDITYQNAGDHEISAIGLILGDLWNKKELYKSAGTFYEISAKKLGRLGDPKIAAKATYKTAEAFFNGEEYCCLPQ